MLAVEGSDDTGSTKKTKADDPDKEIAGCVACRALAVAEKPGNSDKRYYKIYRTKGHALQDCRQVELLAEKQRAEYERRDKEKGQDGAEGSGKKRDGQAGRHGKDKQQERPARGREKSQKTTIMKRTTNPATKSFRKLQRPCASTAAPRCILLTASLNSGRERLQRQSRRLMPKGR